MRVCVCGTAPGVYGQFCSAKIPRTGVHLAPLKRTVPSGLQAIAALSSAMHRIRVRSYVRVHTWPYAPIRHTVRTVLLKLQSDRCRLSLKCINEWLPPVATIGNSHVLRWDANKYYQIGKCVFPCKLATKVAYVTSILLHYNAIGRHR